MESNEMESNEMEPIQPVLVLKGFLTTIIIM